MPRLCEGRGGKPASHCRVEFSMLDQRLETSAFCQLGAALLLQCIAYKCFLLDGSVRELPYLLVLVSLSLRDGGEGIGQHIRPPRFHHRYLPVDPRRQTILKGHHVLGSSPVDWRAIGVARGAKTNGSCVGRSAVVHPPPAEVGWRSGESG